MSKRLPYSVSSEYFDGMTSKLESIPSRPRKTHNVQYALAAAALAMTLIVGTAIQKQMVEQEMDEALEYVLESGMSLAQIEETL